MHIALGFVDLRFNATSLLDSLVTKLQGWLQTAVEMLPNVGAAVAVVIAAWFIARYVGSGIVLAFGRLSADRDSQIPGLLGAFGRIATFTAGLFIALGILQLDKTVTSLLAGVGVIGLALGFAFQDMAANFIAGVMLAIKKPFVAGDVIEYGNEIGSVLRVDLRETALRRFTGEVVIVPNRKLLENELTNVSGARNRRVDVEVGVAYQTDLNDAERVAATSVSALDCVLAEDHEVETFFTSFGDSAINMTVRFWVDYGQRPGDFMRLRSEPIKAIKAGFDDAGIEIPFPIRTLDIPNGAPLPEAAEVEAA